MPSGSLQIEISQGQTLIFIGANGGGKTRLGVYLEEKITNPTVHRIGAQRALQFSTSISLIDIDAAKDKLFYGLNQLSDSHLTREQLPQHKNQSRWGSKPATHFVNDYEALLQALFADETRESVKYRHAMRDKENIALHVDEDVLNWFKAQGTGYQTRMNTVLRAFRMHTRENDVITT